MGDELVDVRYEGFDVAFRGVDLAPGYSCQCQVSSGICLDRVLALHQFAGDLARSFERGCSAGIASFQFTLSIGKLVFVN